MVKAAVDLGCDRRLPRHTLPISFATGANYRQVTVILLLPAANGLEIALQLLQFEIVPPLTWVLAELCNQTPMSEQLVAFTRVIVQSWLVDTLK